MGSTKTNCLGLPADQKEGKQTTWNKSTSKALLQEDNMVTQLKTAAVVAVKSTGSQTSKRAGNSLVMRGAHWIFGTSTLWHYSGGSCHLCMPLGLPTDHKILPCLLFCTLIYRHCMVFNKLTSQVYLNTGFYWSWNCILLLLWHLFQTSIVRFLPQIEVWEVPTEFLMYIIQFSKSRTANIWSASFCRSIGARQG